MAGHPDPTLVRLRQLAADATALANRATEIAAAHPTPSDNLVTRRLEQRISELLEQRAAALLAVRTCSDMLTAIETAKGLEASAALFRVQVTRALQVLGGATAERPPAPGCHPKLQQRMDLVRDLESAPTLDGEPGGAA